MVEDPPSEARWMVDGRVNQGYKAVKTQGGGDRTGPLGKRVGGDELENNACLQTPGPQSPRSGFANPMDKSCHPINSVDSQRHSLHRYDNSRALWAITGNTFQSMTSLSAYSNHLSPWTKIYSARMA